MVSAKENISEGPEGIILESMLEGYAAKDPRFRVVSHKKNESLLASRFTGMREASGKMVLFVDSDDYVEKTNMLPKLLRKKL